MMGDTVKIGERIAALRESKGMMQAQFAAALGVSQSQVSQWEAEVVTPSVEAWIKLSALAADGDPSEAVFFWKQTGLDAATLSSVARALLPEEERKMGAILSAAETVLKRRLADPKELAGEGKMVRVPPFAEGRWKGQVSAEPLYLPASRIANIASTFYVVAGGADHGWGYCPGDTIVFDASGAPSRAAAPLMGSPVLVNFTKSVPPAAEFPAWPTGLFIGRLDLLREIPAVRWVSLVPSEQGHGGDLSSVGMRAIPIATFTPIGDVPGPEREQILRGTRYWKYRNVVRATEAEALSALTLPEGCDIMGVVKALLIGARDR